jgi:hypothetical protein
MYGFLLAGHAANAAVGQCTPADLQLMQKPTNTAIADDVFARGIGDKPPHANAGILGKAVSYLPLGSLAMQLTMRMSRSTLGTMVEAFYDQLGGLTFGADGSDDPDDLNFDQVDGLSAAHRRFVASGAVYEHSRVAKAICRAIKPFTRSQIPTPQSPPAATPTS